MFVDATEDAMIRDISDARYQTMPLTESRDATCPHCWETINLTLDLSIPEQSYIEDCPVCCKPMIVSYSTADGEITALSVEASD
jgi:hypothetical protein